MTFTISVPIQNGSKEISIESGGSIVFVGANGSGKTRLAALIEKSQKLNAHRISAHRALSLNPNVSKVREIDALNNLRFGYANVKSGQELDFRNNRRWNQKEATVLLNDFDFLIQVLFAEQTNKSLETHKKVRSGDNTPAEPTQFEILTNIWEQLLPHRKLYISGDDILVSVTGDDKKYSASEMSDGERAIFYMLGQSIVAAKDSLLIFDEPELHVHPSIMTRLWDEIEAMRPDCAFVFITHDLEFASSRAADKYVLKAYNPTNHWVIEKVPQDSGFDEELTTLILGSRKPVLFVEGSDNSLDISMYRSCFPNWTIIPKGSCEEVIHSVVTMRRNESLTRVTCSGVVDADDYNQEDKDYLAGLGIAILPVSEIENLILMPEVSAAIAKCEGYSGAELEKILTELKESIFKTLDSTKTIEDVIVRYCRRRIDRTLKKVDLSEAETVAEIKEKYNYETKILDIESIAGELRNKIMTAIETKDLPLLLKNYDNKGMMALAASHLKKCQLKSFEKWLVRVLKNGNVPELISAINNLLPEIQAQ